MFMAKMFHMYCNATAVLKIDYLHKQGKNYHPQAYVEERKYTDAENQQCSMLSDDDDDGFFEMQKEGQKIFVTCLGVTKLITNEQNVSVRTRKKVEYTLSKLYENKGRA